MRPHVLSLNLDTSGVFWFTSSFLKQGAPYLRFQEYLDSGHCHLYLCDTAYEEAEAIHKRHAGTEEQQRWKTLKFNRLPDVKFSRLVDLHRKNKVVSKNDALIFGTGHHHQLVTLTSDAKMVTACAQHKVGLATLLVPPVSLIGK